MNNDAWNLALRKLGSRDLSSRDLAAWLESKGVSPEDVAEVLAEFVKRRFVDDARYAAALSRAQARRGKGPAYIRQKLKAKGVSLSNEQIAANSVEATGATELERAREIVERRYPGCRTDKATAVKAVAALQRRGFSYEVARQAVGSPASLQVDDL